MSEKISPCIERSFEAVDEAGHTIIAAIGIDEGVRKVQICHIEDKDGKEHVCYVSDDDPEEKYDFVKKLFEGWGYSIKIVEGESCL